MEIIAEFNDKKGFNVKLTKDKIFVSAIGQEETFALRSVNGVGLYDDIEKYNLEKIGPEFENHKLFPEKCNVTLAKKINNDLIKVKVWERGAGLTKACGTAACATAVAANMDNLKNSKTEIEFGLGKLLIYIDQDEFIHMTGPVSKIEKIELKV